jgi:metal-responsive CopG/Arc/MetJ family transcriptional regulator
MSRGPGRPVIGPSIQVRLEPDVIAKLDRLAASGGTTRAQLIREAVYLLLEHLRGELVTPEEEGT